MCSSDLMMATTEISSLSLHAALPILPAEPITKAETARNALSIAAQHCNLLAPETSLDFIRAHYAISMRVVAFSEGDWYSTDGKQALTYSALCKLAAAAGLTWLTVRRIDDGKTPLFWRFEARARVRLFDGTEREEIASRELDLRDGAPDALSAKSAAGLAKLRSVGPQQCESKAKARVIRALLGVRSYTANEARRPFCWPALVYMPPDTEDVNRMVAAKELGMVEAMYGPRSTARAQVIDVASTPLALEDKGGNHAPDFQAETERLSSRAAVRREVEDVPDEPYSEAGSGYDEPQDDPSWEGDRANFVNAIGKQSYELDDVTVWLRKHNRKQPNAMNLDERRALYQELRSYGGNLPPVQGGAR